VISVGTSRLLPPALHPFSRHHAALIAIHRPIHFIAGIRSSWLSFLSSFFFFLPFSQPPQHSELALCLVSVRLFLARMLFNKTFFVDFSAPSSRASRPQPNSILALLLVLPLSLLVVFLAISCPFSPGPMLFFFRRFAYSRGSEPACLYDDRCPR